MAPARRLSLILLAAIFLVLAAICALLLRTDDLFERLLDDARIAYAPRPASHHADETLPSSFADDVLPAVPVLTHADEAKQPSDAKVEEDVLKGLQPWSALSESYRARLQEELIPAARALLRATHAQRLQFPPGTSFLDPGSGASSSPGGMLQYREATRIAALDARRNLAAGTATSLEGVTAALDECVDGLALGRDLSWSGGLLGSSIGMAALHSVFDVCAVAIDRAPVDRLQVTAARIHRLRTGWKPFPETLRDEWVSQRLTLIGAALTPEQVERLPVPARNYIRSMPAPMITGWRWLAPLTWRVLDAAHQPIADAMQQPEALWPASLAKLQADARHSWNPFLAPAFAYGTIYERTQTARGMLLLLEVEARARSFRIESKRWPGASELARPGTDLSGAGISLDPSDGALRLRLVPVGSEPKEIVVSAPDSVPE
jgi:hypothetical protein